MIYRIGCACGWMAGGIGSDALEFIAGEASAHQGACKSTLTLATRPEPEKWGPELPWCPSNNKEPERSMAQARADALFLPDLVESDRLAMERRRAIFRARQYGESGCAPDQLPWPRAAFARRLGYLDGRR